MLSSSFWTTYARRIFLSLSIQSSLFLCLCSLPFSEPHMRTVYFCLSLFNHLFFFELQYSLFFYLPLSVQSLSFSLPPFLSSFLPTHARLYFCLSVPNLSFFFVHAHFISLCARLMSFYPFISVWSVFLPVSSSTHAHWPFCLSILSLTSLCLFLHWCSPVFLAIPGVWRHPARWQGHPDHRLPSHQVRSPNIYCSANLWLYHRTFLLSLCQVKALKGQCHEIFASCFFMNQFPPSPRVNDTGGAPWDTNISVNFRKNSKRPKWYTQGLGGNWFMKKTRSRKSRDPVPLSNKTFFYLLMSLTLIRYNHHNCTLWWSPRVL